MSGQTSTLLGNLHSAGIGLTMQYANLNQPQIITAPTALASYSVFQTKLRAFLQGLQTGIGNTTAGGGSTPGGGIAAGGAPSTGSTGNGAGSNDQAYTQCIQSAGADIAKMQQCAPLLNAK